MGRGGCPGPCVIDWAWGETKRAREGPGFATRRAGRAGGDGAPPRLEFRDAPPQPLELVGGRRSPGCPSQRQAECRGPPAARPQVRSPCVPPAGRTAGRDLDAEVQWELGRGNLSPLPLTSTVVVIGTLSPSIQPPILCLQNTMNCRKSLFIGRYRRGILRHIPKHDELSSSSNSSSDRPPEAGTQGHLTGSRFRGNRRVMPLRNST